MTVPFILPNLYYRLHKLPIKELSKDSNYYTWMEDIWKYVEPSYEAFYSWARQRCSGVITDLGCGNGNAGKALGATHFYDYVKGFPEVEFIDLNDMSYKTLLGNTFILSHVLEHLRDPKTTLEMIKGSILPGSKIIICVPDGGSLESSALPFQQYIPSNEGTAKHIHHVYAWTSADLFNTLTSQGWTGIDMGFSNVNGFSCIWAMAVKPPERSL